MNIVYDKTYRYNKYIANMDCWLMQLHIARKSKITDFIVNNSVIKS